MRNIQDRVLLETHAHTAEVSGCATLTAAQQVQQYHALGYQGMVITDHYQVGSGVTIQKRRAFLSGYHAAAQEGKRLGIAVMLGMELRFAQGLEDFLVYGAHEEEILALPDDVCDWTPGRFLEYSRGLGWILCQAHPFRRGLRVMPPEVLDGIEVYNGNPRHNSHNDLADAYAREHGLIRIAGSDAHEEGDPGVAGLWVPESALTPEGLVRHLRAVRSPQLYIQQRSSEV